ncbi:MAG TPA: protein phosphatase 2C domain-containing protein [Thermoanaerobaculaceae bacterium]|nr:protein phosphatase 2C domain-containing protein [Thermoanaerobaculaceae bacterium]
MSVPQGLRVGALSHIGLVRRENQDRMARFTCPFGEVFIVADGMGGHKGGSQAASMVVEGFESYLRQALPRQPLRAALMAASAHVNSAVCAAATSGDPLTDHMGSTAVILVVAGRDVLIGHLGDSRAYLSRGDHLVRLTRDHTWVQQLVDQNLLSEEEARNHPDASVLAHAFGRESGLSLELSPGLAIHRGDTILLCSDGLSGYLTDDEISGILARRGDPQPTAADLVEAALATGGHDNITVQLVVFSERPRRHTRRTLGRAGGVLPGQRQDREGPAAAELLPPATAEADTSPAPHQDLLPHQPPSRDPTPEMVPTQPALPLPPTPSVSTTLETPRRRRAAGLLVVIATLAGAVALVLGMWFLLQPPSPPALAPPVAAPDPTAIPTPTPTAEPDTVPDSGALTVPLPQSSPAPTQPPTAGPSVPDSDSTGGTP